MIQQRALIHRFEMQVKVIPLSRWQSELAERLELNWTAARRGAKLWAVHSCNVCHKSNRTDEQPTIGPSLFGLYGRRDYELSDGSKVAIVDDAYLRQEINLPNGRITQGYTAGTMPSYMGILTDADIDALVAYIKEQ